MELLANDDMFEFGLLDAVTEDGEPGTVLTWRPRLDLRTRVPARKASVWVIYRYRPSHVRWPQLQGMSLGRLNDMLVLPSVSEGTRQIHEYLFVVVQRNAAKPVERLHQLCKQTGRFGRPDQLIASRSGNKLLLDPREFGLRVIGKTQCVQYVSDDPDDN